MIIIQQGDLVLTDRILTGDLLIDGDKIVAIDEHVPVPEGAKVIDAKGCYVFPGFIDPSYTLSNDKCFSVYCG